MEFSDQLVALVCAYNEAELLPGLLDNLEPHVDRVVVADGRYQLYPGERWDSDDGTVEIVEDRGVDFIPAPPDGPWPSEHEKRTALLEECRMGDEILVIDADERLAVNGSFSLRDLYGDYKLWICGIPPTPGRQDACRLFMYRPGLHYRFHFGVYTTAGRNVLKGYSHLPITRIRIDHYHHLRDPDRVAADKEYEAELVPFEASLGAYGGRQ